MRAVLFANDPAATWYETGLGACGITNSDSDLIVAVGHGLFDAYPYVPRPPFRCRAQQLMPASAAAAIPARTRTTTPSAEGPSPLTVCYFSEDITIKTSYVLKKYLNLANGNSVTVKITDRCAGCQGQGDLDFSPAAFQQLAPLSVGRIHGMTWSFN